MNKLFVISALFVGCLLSASKTEAASENADNYKKLDTTHRNPWDPRGNEVASNQDSSGAEILPEPERSEAETEE